MTDREAMKLALDFLESGMPSDPYGMDKEQHQIAITALRQALEQPEQPKFFYGQDPNVLTTHDKGAVNE